MTLVSLFAATSCASPTSEPSNKNITKVSTSKTKIQAVQPKELTGKRIGVDKHNMPTYTDDARTRYVRATAFSHMEKEPGAPGRKNAAGTILKYGKIRSAAADWSRLPLGTKFKIAVQPDITYVVDDYGSALAGTNTVDMFFPTLRQMNRWGTRKITIQIIQMGSFERSAKLLSGRQHAWHCRKMFTAIKAKIGNSYVKN